MANETNIGGASLQFTVDGSQAIVALDQIEEKAEQVDVTAGKAAAALGGLGDRVGAGAQKADRSTQQLLTSIQRATAAFEAGERGTGSYFESIAKQRGVPIEKIEAAIVVLERQRVAHLAVAQAARDEAEAQREAAAAKRADESFISSLQRQAAAIGKTRADLLEMEAAQRGLSAQAAPFVTRLRESEKALHGVGVSAGQTRAAMAQLPAQFTDVFTSLAGGQNPLLVLIQQGGQIKDSFGGVGNALRSIGSLIKPAYVGVGLLGAAMTLFAKAALDGAEETKELADALKLTGNAAGQSQGQIDSLVKSLASSGDRAVGALRGTATELAKTGAIGPLAFASATEAAERYAEATGKTAAETAKDFASMARDPAKWAQEAQRSFGLLTVTQYQYVRSLQERGQLEQAQVVITDALNQRLKGLDNNLGSIDRLLKAGKNAWSEYWDAAKGIGRPETVQDELAKIEAQIKRVREVQRAAPGIGAADLNAFSGKPTLGGRGSEAGLLDKQADALRRQFRQAESAAADALRTEGRKAGSELVDQFGEARTAVQRLDKDITAFKERARVARLGIFDPAELQDFDSKVSASLNAITQKSEATGQSTAAMMARIDGGLQAALDASRTQQDRLSRQSELGLVSQFGLERELSALRLKDNQAQLDALKAREGQVGRQREPLVELIKLENERNALIRARKALLDAEARVIADMVALGERRQVSPQEAFRTSERQADQGIDDGLRQQRLALTVAIQDQARAQAFANEELALETALIGKTATARSVAIQQLRIEQQLREQIRQIEAANPPGAGRDAAVSAATATANAAAGNVASKASVDYIADLLDPTRAKTFGEALTAAFDGAGNSLVKLTNLFQGYAAEQAKLNAAFKFNRDDEGNVKSLKTENALIEQQGRLQIGTYASMAGAAKGFFEEGSKGYKALHAAETAFQAFQLASDLIKGVSAAAVGVATQAQGEPYTALPRMAVMAAAMASLGFATGFFGSSGGGTQAAATDRQGGAATGRIVTLDQLDRSKAAFRGGSVFGDDEARSESISKSIDILSDVARLELPIARSQLNALEAIRDSMAGVASLIVRSVGGGLTTGANLGIPTGTLSKNRGDPFNDATKGLTIAGAVNTVFTNDPIFGGLTKTLQGLWGKVKQDVVDSGLSILGSVGDLTAGRGVEQFADVKTTTSSFFGLRKKTNDSTVFADVEATLAAQFGLIFKSIGDTVAASAEVLGREGGDALAAAIAAFPVAIERLSLKDLKGDELQEAISAAIGAQADTIAKALVPGLEAFQVVGEGYFETLIKVSSGIELATYQLELLGISAVEYTDVIRKQGDVSAEIVRQSIAVAETIGGALSSVGAIVNTLSGASQDLVETYTALVGVRTALIKVGESGETLTVAMIRGAGGLDNLASSLDTYFSEFFSEQEQLSANASALTAEFGKLGLALPLSRDGFRDLITALNDGTDAGAVMAAKVLGLAGAFDEVADAAEEAAGRLTDSISEAIGRFGTQQERQGASFGGIATSLQRDAGVSVSISQLIGATPEEIEAATRSFLALSNVSEGAKTAFINAALALVDLKDEAASTLGGLEIELLRAQGRELEAVAVERRAEIDQLAALETSLGVAAGTFTKLQEEIYAAADAAKVLSGLDNVIADFLKPKDLAFFRATKIQNTLATGGITGITVEQIMGATTDDIVALWQSVGTAGKQAILDSYGLLSELQTDLTKEQRKAQEDQLTGMKGLRDLAREMSGFVSELKFGDLSPLSAETQLAEAQSLFESTLSKALGGDTKAQGSLQSVAQALLTEAKGAYASGPGYTAIFERVTGALEALGVTGNALDPQIEYLESLSDNSRGMLDALLSIDTTLKTGSQTGAGSGPSFIAGPPGSSGGLSRAPFDGADLLTAATVTSNEAPVQTDLLRDLGTLLGQVLAKLDQAVVVGEAGVQVSQLGFPGVIAAVQAVGQPLDEMAREARLASGQARSLALA